MQDALVALVCLAIPGVVIFHAFRSMRRRTRGDGGQGDGSWTYSSDGSSDSGGDSDGGGDGGGGGGD